MILQAQEEMIYSKVQNVLSQIAKAATNYKRTQEIRLVAVSKTKTVEEIQKAYDCGVRHFGENYVDEIESKQPKLPQDIKWHFIGHLQSNKIKKVVVPNLQYIETVDRESLAEKLQKHLQKTDKEKKLKILIQVKTSEQETKHGASPQEVLALLGFIYEKCPNLMFKGLMTIGRQGDYNAFLQLVQLKEKIIQKYKIPQQQFELSMGMSGDFEKAVLIEQGQIEYGSTSVRIGSSIFGPRNYPKKEEPKVEVVEHL